MDVKNDLRKAMPKRVVTPHTSIQSMKLSSNRYGKTKVRVLKKLRENGVHTIKELEVKIILEGVFDAAFTAGDNREVIATDTMKNTINVFAHDKLGLETEPFIVELTADFLDKYPRVTNIQVETEERVWERIAANGSPSPTNFSVAGNMTPTTQVTRSRNHLEINSGVRGLIILKSAGSGFTDFQRDKFTTLPETDDRLLATSLTSQWLYRAKPVDYRLTNARVVATMLSAFSSKESPSVQTSLYDMGKAALAECSEIERISLTMPNLHCLLIDLSPFHRQNQNTLFVPTDAPQGWIEGTVARDE
jgi:urate oxidase